LECCQERAEANGGSLIAGDTGCCQWNEYNAINNPAVCCPSNDRSPECCAQAVTNNKLPSEYREQCCEHSQFTNNPECEACDPAARRACGVGSSYHKEKWGTRTKSGVVSPEDWFGRSGTSSCFRRYEHCGDCANCVAACTAGENHHRIHSLSWWKKKNNANNECSDSGTYSANERCMGLECLLACDDVCNGAFTGIPTLSTVGQGPSQCDKK